MADPTQNGSNSFERSLNPGASYTIKLDKDGLLNSNRNYLLQISGWFKDIDKFISRDPAILNGDTDLVALLLYVRDDINVLSRGGKVDVKFLRECVDYLRSVILHNINEEPVLVHELDTRVSSEGLEEEPEASVPSDHYYFVNHNFQGMEDKTWEILNYYLPNLLNNLKYIEG